MFALSQQNWNIIVTKPWTIFHEKSTVMNDKFLVERWDSMLLLILIHFSMVFHHFHRWWKFYRLSFYSVSNMRNTYMKPTCCEVRAKKLPKHNLWKKFQQTTPRERENGIKKIVQKPRCEGSDLVGIICDD